MKKVELLSPAGSMEALKAAICAGADAVYLGGKLFGARAFAKNFEKDELIEALYYAHVFDRKIYLTFNTLIRESEYGEIYDFLAPLYENGLDGIIIQDMGLIPYLKDCFPKLELHISTQMTVTGWRGAEFLFQQGITRIVPARELSFEEIKEIKTKVPVEIEAFVHGAMCYCYSGQCLFSSFLGGRSGNRGKCAQPCRLPYSIQGQNISSVKKKEEYPLSLKDLCTVTMIPQLIEAGIDSFKIEGRMKSPEYVAGVTAIYRKYIDLYESGAPFRVEESDQRKLCQLYIRSDVQNGYYTRHNGKDMITLSSPSYAGNDEQLISAIHEKYCTDEMKISVQAEAYFYKNRPASLTLKSKTASFTAEGETVAAALNKPLEKADIKKQLLKTKNTFYQIQQLDIYMDEDCFYQLKGLNELRRSALEGLQQEILKNTLGRTHEEILLSKPLKKETENINLTPCLSVMVTTKEQLQAAFVCNPDRIYISADEIFLGRIQLPQITELKKNKITSDIFVSLPKIIRKRDDSYLLWLKQFLTETNTAGVLVKNLEELSWIHQIGYQGKIITDHNLYIWNQNSLRFMLDYADGFCAPLELNKRDLQAILTPAAELIVYGHMPMMVSANCILKTKNLCRHDNNSFSQSLTDRYHKELPVYCNCVHCYNEIYNAIALSLHKELDTCLKMGFLRFQLSFTTENKEEAVSILKAYQRILFDKDSSGAFPITDYTTGHSNKGAL